MKRILEIKTISEYNSLRGLETFHPLVNVFDFSKTKLKDYPESDAISFGFYAISLKQGQSCIIHYGRKNYDYQDGTLVFLAPRQVFSIQPGYSINPEGFALHFHPDLIQGTSLAQKMKDYTFFSYDVNEALHVSEREKQIITECFHKIEYEIKLNPDKHSKKLIVANIELFLDYCLRFYDRQFLSRENMNQGVVNKFENLLHDYFLSDKPQTIGPPSVGYFADKLNLSANYLGDLIKKETGKSAQEQIQLKMVEIAKQRIFEHDKTISEIAYELGFKYPQHFTRFFKQQIGSTPNEYRNAAN